MKKVQILLVTLLVGSLAFFSFKIPTNSTRYGGTASVTVKVGKQTAPTCWDASMKAREGDTRVIEVSVSCNSSTSSDAKTRLLDDIKNEMKCYEKMSSSVTYDIDTCD